jgi:hypothetical protein
VPCLPMSLSDLITLQRLSGAPNIRTFVNISDASEDIGAVPDGPSAAERATSPYLAVAAVTFEDESVCRGVLHSVNGYASTSQASVIAAKTVLSGAYKPGF